MKKLPSMLKKDGFNLTLVERKGNVCIYKHQHPLGEAECFEVVIPAVYHKDFTGKEVEPYESYPGTNTWGKKGFTCLTLERARSKMEELHENN